MPPPVKRVKATTYRCDSPDVAKLCRRLIAETDTRSVGDSHPSCFVLARKTFNDAFMTNMKMATVYSSVFITIVCNCIYINGQPFAVCDMFKTFTKFELHMTFHPGGTTELGMA